MAGHDLHPPISAVREAVARAIAEDLTPIGDLTSALLPGRPRRDGRVRRPRRPACSPAGCAPTRRSARSTPRIEVEWSADDGDRVEPGVAFGAVSGRLASMLTAERTALNFLCHLSGVATLTARVRRRHRRTRADLGHAQDDTGAARAGEGRGARRRRCQPPRQPLRLGDAQGQPPRAARHRRRRRPRPGPLARPHRPRRVRRPRRRWSKRWPPAPTPCCSTT